MTKFIHPKNQPILDFTVPIERTGKTRNVLVWVFEDDATLQACTDELHEGTPHGDAGFAYTMVHTAKEIEDEPRTAAAHIVLSLPHMHVRSVCHEIFHVAIHLFDMDCGAEKILELREQEIAAYIVSDLSYQIFGKLRDAGYLQTIKL